MADDGPDLSCFDFANSGDEEESREDVLKKHREEEEQLRAEAKAKKKAIDKSDKPARRACEAELAEALEQLAARHAKELAGLEDAAGAEAMAALAISEAKQGKSAKRRQKREQEEREREQRIADEKAGVGPSQRELEMAQLEQQLLPLGRRIAEIPADGHCLYRAVAQQLMQHGAEGVEEDYSACRRLAAAYMRSHPGDFLPYIAAEGTDVATYTEQVEGSSEWGGQLEITALAHARKRTIAVFSATAPLLVTGEEYADNGPRLELCYHKHYYGLGEHYNAVVPS